MKRNLVHIRTRDIIGSECSELFDLKTGEVLFGIYENDFEDGDDSRLGFVTHVAGKGIPCYLVDSKGLKYFDLDKLKKLVWSKIKSMERSRRGGKPDPVTLSSSGRVVARISAVGDPDTDCPWYEEDEDDDEDEDNDED